jgi:hypothetical protein
MTRLPATYHHADGCHNCEHVVEKATYIDGIYRYCTFGAPPAPKMPDALSGDITRQILNTCIKAWRQWGEDRQVHPHGICDEHKRVADGGGEGTG